MITTSSMSARHPTEAASRERGGDITVGADLGQQRGGNLFHSFRKFDLDTGGLLPGVVGLEDRPGDVRQPQPVLGNGATCCHRPT